jgi:hypothetical protein
MSAVYNNQDDLSASIEAKKLADEIIAAKASGKVDALDIKTKLENLDSVQMDQLIGILHETFDIGGTNSIDNKKPPMIQNIKEGFERLIENIKKHPELYMPELCVDGKLSVDLASKFCIGQAALVKAQIGALANPSTTSASVATSTAPSTETDSTASSTTTSTTNTTTEGDSKDHNYSSYLSMAKVVADVAYDLSFIQSKVTEDSSLQTKWLAEENEALINSAQSELDDINKQIDKYESEKRHAEHMKRTMGILTHVLGAFSVAFCAVCCPALLPLVLITFADQEYALNSGNEGFISMGAREIGNAYAADLELMGIHVSPETAKLIGDIVMIIIVAGACAASGNEGMAIIVAATLAESTGLFSDIADVRLKAEGIDPNDPNDPHAKKAQDTKMACMIAGAFICIVASCAGAAVMAEEAAAEVAAQASAKAAEEEAAQLAQAATDVAGTPTATAANDLATAAAEYAAAAAEYAGTGGETAVERIASSLSNSLRSIAEIPGNTARSIAASIGKMVNLSAEQVQVDLLTFGMFGQVGLMATESGLSKSLSDTLKVQADTMLDIENMSADLQLKQATADQFGTLATNQASNAQKEVSSLAQSFNSYLSYVDRAALGSVIQV